MLVKLVWHVLLLVRLFDLPHLGLCTGRSTCQDFDGNEVGTRSAPVAENVTENGSSEAGSSVSGPWSRP